MVALFIDLECSNNDTVYPVIVRFGRWNLGADHDHVDEVSERRLSIRVEDSLHLSPYIAGCDASESRFVLDQTTFLVFRHGR